MKVYKDKHAKLFIFSLLIVSTFSFIFLFGFKDKSRDDMKEVFLDSDENSKEINEQYCILLENLFDYRNKAILEKNESILKDLYDTDIKFGLWAYEHEVKKMQYLENWSSKQGVKFNDIKTKVKIKKMKEREKNLYGIICDVSTEYKYSYGNEPSKENMFLF